MPSTISRWIFAIRPKTLFASIAPVLLGLTIAYIQQNHLNVLVAILTMFCAVLMQIATNIANDYLDSLKGIDTDHRLGPMRVTHAGLISATSMKNALILVLTAAFLMGIYLMWVGGPVIVLIGLLSLYFAYGYTGGPFPLSYNGLGEVAAFIFFGIIAVSGTTYLQTHHFTSLSLVMGMGPGFISATVLAINNLRDIQSDSETNKRTIAVRFGESFQRKLCVALIASSSLLLIIVAIAFHYPWLIPACILPLLFMKNWFRIASGPVDKTLNQALAKTAIYLLFYCILASAGLLISTGKLL